MTATPRTQGPRDLGGAPAAPRKTGSDRCRMGDWFVLNVADAPAFRHDRAGDTIGFESADERFPRSA